jgi:phage gp46-like protein
MIADVAIYEAGSGGEWILKNDDIDTISGLTNQVYLALFGGNIEQDTSDDLLDLDQRNDWWGNFLLKEENQFNSTFERTLKTIALNSSGLSKLENAAKEDLQFLKEYADIEIDSQITGVNKMTLFVNVIEPNSQSTKLKFVWDGTRNEIIEEITL